MAGPFRVLLSGDMQGGTDHLLLSGDMQSGTDVELYNAREFAAALVSGPATTPTLIESLGTIHTYGAFVAGVSQLAGSVKAIVGIDAGLVSGVSTVTASGKVYVAATASLLSGAADLSSDVAPIAAVLADIMSEAAVLAARAQTVDAALFYAAVASGVGSIASLSKSSVKTYAGGVSTWLKLSGDMQSTGIDDLLLSGDMGAGGARLLLSGDGRLSQGLLAGAAHTSAEVAPLVRAFTQLVSQPGQVHAGTLAQMIVRADLESGRSIVLAEVDLDNMHRRLIVPIYY